MKVTRSKRQSLDSSAVFAIQHGGRNMSGDSSVKSGRRRSGRLSMLPGILSISPLPSDGAGIVQLNGYTSRDAGHTPPLQRSKSSRSKPATPHAVVMEFGARKESRKSWREATKSRNDHQDSFYACGRATICSSRGGSETEDICNLSFSPGSRRKRRRESSSSSPSLTSPLPLQPLQQIENAVDGERRQQDAGHTPKTKRLRPLNPDEAHHVKGHIEAEFNRIPSCDSGKPGKLLINSKPPVSSHYHKSGQKASVRTLKRSMSSMCGLRRGPGTPQSSAPVPHRLSVSATKPSGYALLDSDSGEDKNSKPAKGRRRSRRLSLSILSDFGYKSMSEEVDTEKNEKSKGGRRKSLIRTAWDKISKQSKTPKNNRDSNKTGVNFLNPAFIDDSFALTTDAPHREHHHSNNIDSETKPEKKVKSRRSLNSSVLSGLGIKAGRRNAGSTPGTVKKSKYRERLIE